MTVRRIALLTGSRAEWGIVRWLAADLHAAPDLDLLLVVTGSHLAAAHGGTEAEITATGLPVAVRVDMLLHGDSPLAVAKSVGIGVMGLAEALDRLAPDLVVVTGDRFEMMAGAQAALMLGVPLAHLHGGELTEGMRDDAIRHALTKMAHLHFVAAAPYAHRVRRMGEAPARVFVVGAPALDALARLPLPDRATLAADLGLDPARPWLLVTWHPVSEDDSGVAAMTGALDSQPEARVILTGVNADPGRERVAAHLRAWAAAQGDRVVAVPSLGQLRYLGVLAQAAAVVGNSSSGLVEAPAFGVPTVNIGPRQEGRLRADSVLDCPAEPRAVADTLARALDPTFRAGLTGMVPPYGGAGASARILAILRTLDPALLGVKRFHDGADTPAGEKGWS